MNTSLPTIVPILAIPLGIVPLPDAAALNPTLAALFTARMRSDAARQSNPLCYRSRDDLLEWPETPIRQLAAELFRGVGAVINAVNDFSAVQWQSLKPEARSWFTVVKPDGCIPATNYPLTAWCGIYCVAAPGPAELRNDSGSLRLYESRPNTMVADATSAVMLMPFTPGHHSWRPVPGHLAVFPASLTHEVALLRAPGDLVLVTVRVRFVGPGQHGLARW